MKKFILFMLVVIAVVLSSCRVTDFTVISSKNVDLNVNKDAARVKAWGWTVKDALDKAIEKSGSGNNALIDGVIYQRFFGYSVKGTPVKITK